MAGIKIPLWPWLAAFIFSELLITACSTFQSETPPDFYPKIQDPSIQLELIASEPDIVTPIGIAIDNQDALYVLESHTHSPPKDYAGPAFDRIKKGIDDNGDGVPDRWTVFADSIENGANLAIDPEGRIYLTAKKSVEVYHDTDGDGKSDRRNTLISMPLPEYVYDHAGLLGIALGPDNWVYVSRGNLSSKAWMLTGTDGKSIGGYGEGGIVFRFKKDGTQLEKIATGFWNPFELQFTLGGRLLLTDNDPDSRGPNRLIEVVPGGDYGFKDLYGGSGLHSYVSWNGELPGTLPYAAALGEAPCALIDAGKTNFGKSYAGNVLVNVWEENNIVRIPLSQNGSSVTGKAEILVQGDSSFHPVAFAVNSKGDLYITDWVIREYPNHGSGRIWRLSGSETPARGIQKNAPDKINRFAVNKTSPEQLLESLQSDDAFEQAIARQKLTDPAFQQDMTRLISSEDAGMRLQGLLVYLKAEYEMEKKLLQRLLADPEEKIRRMALVYTGTKMRTDLRDALNEMLPTGGVSPALFETYLATLQHLQPEFIENYTARSGKSTDKLEHKLPDQYVEKLIGNTSLAEEIRAMAVPYLENPDRELKLLLRQLRMAKNSEYKLALIKSLRNASGEEVASAMLAVAREANETEEVRAHALLSLSFQTGNYCNEVKEILQADQELVRQEALKYLCRCSNNSELTAEVDLVLTANYNEGLITSWNICTNRTEDLPKTNEEWAAAVDEDGQALRGQLIFESSRSMCQTCHRVNGWGSTYGPDLSQVGSSKSRDQLIDAILDPSLEISPEWQGWYVVDKRGIRHTGRQIDVNLDFIELLNMQGSFDRYEQPKSFGVLDQSLMPPGLQNTMTPAEFNDLIAYLESLN